MIAHPEMVALGFDIRIAHLEVEELVRVWPSRDPPGIEVEQPAKEGELSLVVHDLDLHEVREVTDEVSDAAPQGLHIGFDLRPQQDLGSAA